MTTETVLRRAKSIPELLEKFTAFPTEDGIAQWQAFEPKADDVFIAPFAKCGTTWVQQIVHGLRTRGSMDFGEITEVVPWLEMAHDLGLGPDRPQVASPRAFKSHLAWDPIPKGGRYINVFRDPKDALVSMYRFLEGWYFDGDAISIKSFALDLYAVDGEKYDYWKHTASWWRQRGHDDVLLLCYEDMKQDLIGTIKQIAAFIQVPLEDELLAIVERQAGLEFMQAHAHQFDDNLLRRVCDEATGLPPGGNSSKVRTGKTGGGKQLLDDEVMARLDERWRGTMTAEFGLSDYQALRDAFGNPEI